MAHCQLPWLIVTHTSIMCVLVGICSGPGQSNDGERKKHSAHPPAPPGTLEATICVPGPDTVPS